MIATVLVSATTGWTGQVFAYCERGSDPGWLAEPLNAASNLMFFVAAIVGGIAWQRQPAGHRGGVELALIGLVVCIGAGSTLFHTLATRWAGVADTAPIGLFMLAYLTYALRRFCRLPWRWTAASVAVFVASLPVASMARCGAVPCLNGSLAYLPALCALALVGAGLARARHPAAGAVITAAAIFAAALAARTADRALCPYTVIAARAVGTHALWHVLNGVLLLVLLLAAVRHGRLARR